MAKVDKGKAVALTGEQKLEKKRAAFRRVVTPRVNRAFKAIHLVGNCASSGYSFTPEEAASICKALQAAVDVVTAAYSKKTDKQASFSFPS